MKVYGSALIVFMSQGDNMDSIRFALEGMSQQLQAVMAVLENDYEEPYISGHLAAADEILDYVMTFTLPGDHGYDEQHNKNS